MGQISLKKKKYIELNENETTMYQKLQDAAKSSAEKNLWHYIQQKRLENSQINNLCIEIV